MNGAIYSWMRLPTSLTIKTAFSQTCPQANLGTPRPPHTQLRVPSQVTLGYIKLIVKDKQTTTTPQQSTLTPIYRLPFLG